MPEHIAYLCPYCGGDDLSFSSQYSLDDGPGRMRRFVECGTCGARGPLAETQSGALLLWNHRANRGEKEDIAEQYWRWRMNTEL